MRKFALFLFFLFLSMPFISWASTKKEINEKKFLESYYHSIFIGEKKSLNYSGPLNPLSRFNAESGYMQFVDEQFNNNYLNNQIQNDSFGLQDFWFNKIVEKSNCPDTNLGENLEYIRYLYRLLTISYLFESMKLNNHISLSLWNNKNICSLSFEETFGSCKPHSDDMKKFHQRVQGKMTNSNSELNAPTFTKKEVKAWKENFDKSNSFTSNPIFARLHEWCNEQNINCTNLSYEDLKKALGNICNDDRKIIQNLCSENDSLYGASYVDKATDLIQSSNAFNLINQNGMGEDCLRRYVKVFSSKEIKYKNLSRQFSLIYSQLYREKSPYLQGEIFLPGALKEFDMKGLSDFLVALKAPKIEVMIKVKPKPITAPKRPVAIVLEKITVIPELKSPQVEIIEKPKLSEFEKVTLELDELKFETRSVNMKNFLDDFKFTPQNINELKAPFSKFQTREALSDMKMLDNFGNKDAPVGLTFIKYLIVTDNHLGLYNLISILGNKFYVVNDIEKKNRPIFIELKNDMSTKNYWQIILVKKTEQHENKNALEEL